MKIVRKIATVGTMLLAGGVIYSLLEPFRYVVKNYEIKHPKIPESFDGYKIVFLADIHYGRATRENFLNRIIKRTNSLKPDLILLGGDYVTDRTHIQPCFEILSQLEAKDGVFGVLGNHDVVEGEGETLEHMRRHTIQSLNNEAVWIGEKDKIKIGGVGDLWTQSQNIGPFIGDLLDDDYSILLTHNPKYINEIEEIDKVGLILGGHTHGGQIKHIKYLDRVVSDGINQNIGLEYFSGKYNKGDTDIIVSNGIGTAKFPLRFMAPPEIIVITLNSAK